MFPTLPTYSGPHQVGTIDIESPISELSPPAPRPTGFDVPTIKARIFYPCRYPEKRATPAYWVPDPQWEYLEGFAAFLGASNKLAKAIAYSSYFIRSTRIPAFANAPLLASSTRSRRWPVLVFSHGLGGGRNTYSQICGLIASHGVIVIAVEHRDGSGPVSFVTDRNGKPSSISFQRIDYKPSPETWVKRSEQLRIRLWELGALHDLLTQLDAGKHITNYIKDNADGADAVLEAFKSRLEVHSPGSISWAGHSFGAASIVQFIKSVYYDASSAPKDYRPLYKPSRNSPLVTQITPSSPIILQDLWSYALIDPAMSWLRERPLPSYQSPNVGGSNILVLLSEAFVKWEKNFNAIKEAVSPTSTAAKGVTLPHLFYVANSAHLSQSDFGVLFPWVTRLVFKAQDSSRILRLNSRAIVEVMRRAGIEVARTTEVDMEVPGAKLGRKRPESEKTDPRSFSDKDILSTKGTIRGWIALDLKAASSQVEGANKTDESAKPIDRELEN